jgi:flagellar biosynthesis protein
MLKKRKKAVALKYDQEVGRSEKAAPQVVAKGAGLVAEAILKKANEAGVYIHEDQDLVEVLSKVEIGAEIPDELYEAVAKVLAIVYRLNKDS